MEVMKETLNSIAFIMRFIPIPREIKNYILGLSVLIGMFVWYKMYF